MVFPPSSEVKNHSHTSKCSKRKVIISHTSTKFKTRVIIKIISRIWSRLIKLKEANNPQIRSNRWEADCVLLLEGTLSRSLAISVLRTVTGNEIRLPGPVCVTERSYGVPTLGRTQNWCKFCVIISFNHSSSCLKIQNCYLLWGNKKTAAVLLHAVQVIIKTLQHKFLLQKIIFVCKFVK